MPTRSIASHAVSSSTRCCGSRATASRGEMPKKAASKPAASSRNPPDPVAEVPVAPAAPSGSCRSRSQLRSAGNPEIASPPALTNRQRSSGEEIPPG